MVGVSGKVYFAVLADDVAFLVDDDRSIVVADFAIFDRAFGEAKIKADPASPGFLEQRQGVTRRHRVLEKTVDFLLILHPPAGEKGGEREFRINDDVAFHIVSLAHQIDQSRDHRLAAVVSRDRTQLRSTDLKESAHFATPWNRYIH